MKRTNNNRQALIWGIVMLAVLGFTVGIFLTFVPSAPRYSYWIAMTDVCVIEVVAGTYLIYNLVLSMGSATSRLPVAMHISIQSTVGIFFAISIAIVIVFLLVFNRSDLDRAFMWLVIGKWVLLLLVVSLLWFAGQEGEEERATLASSRKERVGVLSVVQRALVELRRLPTSSEEGALQRQVVDELETLRNQLRSRTSERPRANNESRHLDDLLNELTSAVSNLRSTPESERKAVLVRVQDAVRKMAQEIGYPSAMKKA